MTQATTPKRPKAAAAIAQRIREQIASGELNEGDSLPPESDLVSEYRVSRPTLREAFRVLESEGLITIARGAKGGARVHSPQADVISRYVGLILQTQGAGHRDVLEALQIMLPPACRLAAERATEEEFELLREQLQTLSECVGERSHFNQEATRFLEAMFGMTRNQTLSLASGVALHIYNESVGSFPTTQENRDWILHQFSELLRLLEQRQGRAAEGLWHDYVTEILKLADASSELKNGPVRTTLS